MSNSNSTTSFEFIFSPNCKRMFQGTVYLLSSPNYPKCYIGSTIQTLNKRLYCHRSPWNTCRSKELFLACPNTVEVKILEEVEVRSRKELQLYEIRYIKKYQDTAMNHNIPLRTRKERYSDNIVQEREYQRNRYAGSAKKNGGDGGYRQLQRYHDQKHSILRRCALMNSWKCNRLPNRSTMIKHDLTEEDVATFVAKMNTP